MSGEDDRSLDSVQDPQDEFALQSRLRACQACKKRKTKCDRLDPCSACKTLNIPCRTAPRPVHPKRPRATLCSLHEDQLEKINSQLLQLQASVNTMKSLPSHTSCPLNKPTRGLFQSPTARPKPWPRSPSNDAAGVHYLGDSSFDVHSQQIGQAIDNSLQKSPASAMTQDVSALLTHQRSTIEADKKETDTFISELPLPPVHMALAVLRLVDVLPYGFFFCAPITDLALFKNICQKVYFPVNGYTKSDFVVVNGGLAGILSKATHDELKSCNIDPEYASEITSLCEGNVTSVLERLGLFFEPTFANLQIILFGAQMTVIRSNPHRAWRLISIACRLCLDIGLNKLTESSDDPELNEKKTCFWFCYSLDRALSLNFGRSPNMMDFDITTSYPSIPSIVADVPFGGKFFSLAFVWFDLAKVQSEIYEKLYSAKGELEDPQMKTQIARRLAGELIALREKCQLDPTPDKEKDPSLDSEMAILSSLTLVYRALQDTKPAHPLRFPDECVETARKALHLNQTLYERFINKADNSVKTYTYWTISFCPFTPYIVVLGTAILNASIEDMELCHKTVLSLDDMADRAPWVKRTASICKVLLQGAQSSIAQSRNISQDVPPYHQPTTMSDDWNWINLPPPENVNINSEDMFQLFDDFMAGNPPSMMSILEQDMGMFGGG